MHGINRINNLNVNENSIQQNNFRGNSTAAERSIFNFTEKQDNNFFSNISNYNIDYSETAENEEVFINLEYIIALYNSDENTNYGKEELAFGLYHSSDMSSLSGYSDKQSDSLSIDDLSSILKYIDKTA